MATDKKATLILEWSNGKDRYRLIAKADHTPGYEDAYVIDRLTEDSLGEPAWVQLHTWRAEKNKCGVGDLLLSALKWSLSDQAERQRLKAAEVNQPALDDLYNR